MGLNVENVLIFLNPLNFAAFWRSVAWSWRLCVVERQREINNRPPPTLYSPLLRTGSRRRELNSPKLCRTSTISDTPARARVIARISGMREKARVLHRSATREVYLPQPQRHIVYIERATPARCPLATAPLFSPFRRWIFQDTNRSPSRHHIRCFVVRRVLALNTKNFYRKPAIWACWFSIVLTIRI